MRRAGQGPLVRGMNGADGCPSCSSVADGYDGFRVHLENHDVALAAVAGEQELVARHQAVAEADDAERLRLGARHQAESRDCDYRKGNE